MLIYNKANTELRDSDGRTAFEDAAEDKGRIFWLSEHLNDTFLTETFFNFVTLDDDIVYTTGETEEVDSYEDLFEDEKEDNRDFIA